MKRDFIGKTVFLVAFVAILVVSVYGFSGKMMQERHDAQNKTSETTSDKQTDNNGLKTTGKTTEITTEKTTEAEEKGEWKLPKATDKLVCFTFDDGPYAPVTNKILDSLEKYNGRATFFVVGVSVIPVARVNAPQNHRHTDIRFDRVVRSTLGRSENLDIFAGIL